MSQFRHSRYVFSSAVLSVSRCFTCCVALLICCNARFPFSCRIHHVINRASPLDYTFLVERGVLFGSLHRHIHDLSDIASSIVARL